ncbi:MAG: GntR family transcriptional regulator [Propylenella sp.]
MTVSARPSAAARPPRAQKESSGGKLRSATLAASIVATLKGRIVAWQYPPEHRLTEEALCAEFGVSRSPVREALRVLATNGFVRRMANRGYAVRQVNLRELEELYEVRLALESYAIGKLAESGAPAETLRALRKTWEDIRRKPDRHKGEDLAVLDTTFHETLTSLIGNEALHQYLKSINERLFVFRMIDFDKPDRVESTCAQHLTILKLVTKGDAEGARAALRRNIEEGRTIVKTTLNEALARAYAIS